MSEPQPRALGLWCGGRRYAAHPTSTRGLPGGWRSVHGRPEHRRPGRSPGSGADEEGLLPRGGHQGRPLRPRGLPAMQGGQCPRGAGPASPPGRPPARGREPTSDASRQSCLPRAWALQGLSAERGAAGSSGEHRRAEPGGGCVRAPAGKRRGHRARGAAGQQAYFLTLGWGLPPTQFCKSKTRRLVEVRQ